MADSNCGCGCDHDHAGHAHGEECCGGHSHTVVISLDGETDVTCNIVGTFDVKDVEYIALQPVDEDEVLIFRYTEDGENVSLDNIDSDEEYEAVAEVFYSLMDEEDDDDFDDEDFDDEDEDLDDEDSDEAK